jgi:hypothetical protein
MNNNLIDKKKEAQELVNSQTMVIRELVMAVYLPDIMQIAYRTIFSIYFWGTEGNSL